MIRRVVATGLGVIAPDGTGTGSFWRSIVAGKPVFRAPTALPGSRLRVAEVLDFEFPEHFQIKPSSLDRHAQFAVTAVGEALLMAGMDGTNTDLSRVAVIIGNGGGGLNTINEQYSRIYREGHMRSHPMAIAKSMGSSSASWVSIAHGLQGPTFAIASACASGTQAIGVAMGMVRSGLVDVVVTGGTEAPLNEGIIRGWDSMRILAPEGCRPFSANRKGLTLGEGAGMLVLESEEHAARRGARVLCQMSGFASCADAADFFNPTREGMARAMREAIADAGLSPADIGYINAHGTGTVINDSMETDAIKQIFTRDSAPPVSSIKGTVGHGLGASGGIEAVATILALQNGALPPTARYDQPDPNCDLDCIPNVARQQQVQVAMSNSFAFGGLNACLVVSQA